MRKIDSAPTITSNTWRRIRVGIARITRAEFPIGVSGGGEGVVCGVTLFSLEKRRPFSALKSRIRSKQLLTADFKAVLLNLTTRYASGAESSNRGE